MPQEQDDFTRDPLIRAFGAVLRGHRERACLSRPQLAEALGCSPQWIEKVETGQKPPSEATAEDLDTYFETPRTFYRMWKEIKRAGKHLASPPGFSKYADLEAEAIGMRSFEAQVFPGLLQVERYARAVMSAGQALDTLEERVASRLGRQAILTKDSALRMWFVLDEAVLRRPVGGADVMREQLTHAVEIITTMPRIQVRILPFSSVTYAGLDGSFTALSMPGGESIAYHEGPEVSQVIEDAATVAEFEVRFGLVTGEALRTHESLMMIRGALEDYK